MFVKKVPISPETRREKNSSHQQRFVGVPRTTLFIGRSLQSQSHSGQIITFFKVSPFLRGTGINLIYFLERFSNLKNKLGSYFNLSRIFFPEGKKRSDQGSSQISTIQKLLSGGITTVRRHRIMLIGKNQGRVRPFCTN